jgi:catechol 2,3-dioxygenase-like lactoylglutathione lyase family enzyme
MARISHIAIAVSDPQAAKDFYVNGLGLEVVGELDSPTAVGYYLSDGYMNLALLKFKSDEPAITEGAPRHAGIHHFGVKVDNMAEARAQIEAAGAVHRPYEGVTEMEKRGNVEVKFTGPDGVTVDLSEDGWAGTVKM